MERLKEFAFFVVQKSRNELQWLAYGLEDKSGIRGTVYWT